MQKQRDRDAEREREIKNNELAKKYKEDYSRRNRKN